MTGRGGGVGEGSTAAPWPGTRPLGFRGGCDRWRGSEEEGRGSEDGRDRERGQGKNGPTGFRVLLGSSSLARLSSSSKLRKT